MERLSNLDVFRAVAALAVCFHHFNREALTGSTVFSRVAEYGNFGVDIFFVISGYVIPLALLRRNFRIGESAIFLKARFLRLYPAYLVAALLTVGLWYGSTLLPGFRGEGGPHITVANALANLTLTCDFFRQDWFGVVFWTLAIEAQYYVVIALCLGFLFHGKAAWRYMAYSRISFGANLAFERFGYPCSFAAGRRSSTSWTTG
jgi:peptidoglycan/LPS O-acetylase OafA/YrhL